MSIHFPILPVDEECASSHIFCTVKVGGNSKIQKQELIIFASVLDAPHTF